MKKLSIISLSAFLMLFVFSCNEQTEVTEPQHGFTEVAIPNHLKSTLKSSTEVDIEEMDIKVTTKDGKEVFGKMRFTIPVGEEETLVNFEMTSNIFQETELTPDFLINYDENSSLKGTMGIGSCLKSCRGDSNEKACRRGCWAELAIKAAVATATVIAVIAAL